MRVALGPSVFRAAHAGGGLWRRVDRGPGPRDVFYGPPFPHPAGMLRWMAEEVGPFGVGAREVMALGRTLQRDGLALSLLVMET